MTSNYEDIFALRGSGYDLAMRRYPEARDEEFRQLVSRADISQSARVADIPAGGGYLRDYLPADSTWLGHEPCTSFTSHSVQVSASDHLLPLPWNDSYIDVALSLAGIHHIEDKLPLFSDIYRVTKPGGRLVVSDVAAGSAVASFLDDYVGAFNSTGHEGLYLDDRTVENISSTGWLVRSVEQVDYHWKFPGLDDMETFCNGLFDINRAKRGQTIQAINDLLSIDDLPGQTKGMRWSLMTIVADRPDL